MQDIPTVEELLSLPYSDFIPAMKTHGLEGYYYMALTHAIGCSATFEEHHEHSLLRVPLELKFRRELIKDDTLRLMDEIRGSMQAIRMAFKPILQPYQLTSENNATHAAVLAQNFLLQHPDCTKADLEKLNKSDPMMQAMRSTLGDEKCKASIVPLVSHYNDLMAEFHKRVQGGCRVCG